MSRTFHFKHRVQLIWSEYFHLIDVLSELMREDKECFYDTRVRVQRLMSMYRPSNYWSWNYSSNPGYWNHLYTEIPNRRLTKSLCHAIVNGRKEADSVVWPLAHKPKTYYY